MCSSSIQPSRRIPARRGRARRALLACGLVGLTWLWLGCSAGTSAPGANGHRTGDDVGLTGDGSQGRIVGRVTIGPLCPVERIPPDPRCQPTAETFAAIRVLILSPAGDLVRTVPLDGSGFYSVDLEPGSYLVDTNRHGPGLAGGSGGSIGGDSARAAEGRTGPGDTLPPPAPGGSEGREDGGPYRVLPVPVQVEAGRVVHVDIDIDTGIR